MDRTLKEKGKERRERSIAWQSILWDGITGIRRKRKERSGRTPDMDFHRSFVGQCR